MILFNKYIKKIRVIRTKFVVYFGFWTLDLFSPDISVGGR
jgi:hypothetical protein